MSQTRVIFIELVFVFDEDEGEGLTDAAEAAAGVSAGVVVVEAAVGLVVDAVGNILAVSFAVMGVGAEEWRVHLSSVSFWTRTTGMGWQVALKRQVRC